MHSPRLLRSFQCVAVLGLCSLSSALHGQTVTVTPAPDGTEIAVPADKSVTASVVVTPTPGTTVTTINAKLDSIVIPEVKLEKASLEAAVSQIRTVVAHLDESTPADKQMSITVDLTPKAQKRVDSKVHLTMDLKAETLRSILGAIAKEAGLEMGVKPSGVTLSATR